jgi:hypothetical protein
VRERFLELQPGRSWIRKDVVRAARPRWRAWSPGVREGSNLKEKETMSRFARFGVVVLVMAVFATSAMAQTANQRLEGMMGVGFSNTAAPVGVRYWMNDGMAVDFGIGLNYEDNQAFTGTSGQETTSFFDYAFDIGLPLVVHGEENMIVYFRPGIMFAGDQAFVTAPTEPGEKGYDTHFRGELALGGEFFLGQLGWPNLSFSGQVGVGLDFMSPRDEGADSSIVFSTSTTGVDITQSASAGFRIYF